MNYAYGFKFKKFGFEFVHKCRNDVCGCFSVYQILGGTIVCFLQPVVLIRCASKKTRAIWWNVGLTVSWHCKFPYKVHKHTIHPSNSVCVVINSLQHWCNSTATAIESSETRPYASTNTKYHIAWRLTTNTQSIFCYVTHFTHFLSRTNPSPDSDCGSLKLSRSEKNSNQLLGIA